MSARSLGPGAWSRPGARGAGSRPGARGAGSRLGLACCLLVWLCACSRGGSTNLPGPQDLAPAQDDGGEDLSAGEADLRPGGPDLRPGDQGGGSDNDLRPGPDLANGDLRLGPDLALPPDMAPAVADIDIYVDNFCKMDVIPKTVSVPRGETRRLTYHNRSKDYAVNVWLSYGGGFLDLATGAVWADRFEHCAFPRPYKAYADISTACSSYRLYIDCP